MTRFNEHRRNFATSMGKSTFSEHILNAGHEIRPMEETMMILHFENNPRRINTLEEFENNESDHFQPHAQHSPPHQPSLPDTTFSSVPDNGPSRQH